MSSSSQSSRSSFSVQKCYCGVVAPVRTSWTEANMGRRFLGCGRYGRSGDTSSCGFFRWIDPQMCECGKEVVPKLLEKIEMLEKEMKKCNVRKGIYKHALVGTWMGIGLLLMYLFSINNDN